MSTRWIALSWLISFSVAFAWLWPLCMLYDSDSYYHLAIAREYGQHGQLHGLPWARFSVMREGFGDKELLFHWLLAPFAAGPAPLTGAKLVIAALVATSCASVTYFARAALGAAAVYLPGVLLLGALSFDMRMVRLRPELLALPLLLWTIGALGRGRYLLAAALSCVFALSYTAVHALLGLCAGCFLIAFLRERRARFGLVLGPLLGAAAGLCLHPHFPHNVRIFLLQNVSFWRYRASDDIGPEIHALGLARFWAFDWAGLLGVALLALALRRSPAPLAPQLRAAGLFFTFAGCVFALLFASAARFAIYAWPFGLLALAYQARLHGFTLDTHALRGRAQLWLVMTLWALGVAPYSHRVLEHEMDLGGSIWPTFLRQLEAFGRVLPNGARVAAPWTASEDYLYFAPQGRYLNLLDPVFMRSAHPRAYEVQRRLFRAELQDLPPALLGELDSEYLAFNARSLPLLAAQVRGDPRFVRMLDSGHVLYRVEPAASARFVLDLRVADTRSQLEGPSARVYPRAGNAEGFVDGARAGGAERCLWYAPIDALPGGSRWEFASSAASTLFLEERTLLKTPGEKQLVLGRGTRFELPPGSAAKPAIEVCSKHGPSSFYLVRLP